MRAKDSQVGNEAPDKAVQQMQQRDKHRNCKWKQSKSVDSNTAGAGKQTNNRPAGLSVHNVPKRVVFFMLLVVLSIGVSAAAFATGLVDARSIELLGKQGGYGAMVAYVVATVVVQFFWLPRLWGLLAAGILFGPALGGLLAFAADTISAAICYTLARNAARDWAASILKRKPKAEHLVRIFAQKKGAVTIALLRASPVAHYTLVSYSAGVSGMTPKAFFIGNTLGLLPGAVLYPLVGDGITKPTSPAFVISTGILLIFLVITIAAAKKALPK